MHRSAAARMLGESRRPLLEALRYLAPHSARIRSSWRKLLRRFEPCAEHVTLLSGLDFVARARDPSFTLRDFWEESARQGEDLAARGVPAECAAAAVDLYVESCLPYLQRGNSAKPEWTAALSRFASVFGFFLLSGYAHHAAAERRRWEERCCQLEYRSREFSARLGEAYEKERRRLTQDLHDEIGHDLIVLKLYTEMISLDLKKGDTGQLRRKLKETVSLIKHALKSVRRLTFDLGPAVWNAQGFLPAVRLYVRQFSRRTAIKARLDSHRLRADLPPRYETALYKVLQGALSNVAAHANADNVKITLASGPGAVTMKVEDDGQGFDIEGKLRVPRQSFGLRAMRERIELLGGAIEFVSYPARPRGAHRGTRIELRLPLAGDRTA